MGETKFYDSRSTLVNCKIPICKNFLPGTVLSKKHPIAPARNMLVLSNTVMTWLNSLLEVVS